MDTGRTDDESIGNIQP